MQTSELDPPEAPGLTAATVTSDRQLAVAAGALDVFASVLGDLDEDLDAEGLDSRAFFSRLCDAACRTTPLSRAVIYLYDDARHRVRPVGGHAVPLERLGEVHVSLDDAPIAQRALLEDRVLAADGPFDEAIHPDLAREFGALVEGRLVCVPVRAGTATAGVVLADLDGHELPAGTERTLWVLGKILALVVAARRATRDHDHARRLRERVRLAREIHDSTIQRLFAVGAVLGGGPLDAESQERCREEIARAQSELREVIASESPMRTAPAVIPLGSELERLRRAHPDLELRTDLPADLPLAPEHEPLAQSIVGEALRNAVRHGRPTTVEVALRPVGEALALEIVSDGAQEPDPEGSAPDPPGGGMGLRLAAVEAIQLGALLEAGPAAGGRWRVRLLLPAVAR